MGKHQSQTQYLKVKWEFIVLSMVKESHTDAVSGYAKTTEQRSSKQRNLPPKYAAAQHCQPDKFILPSHALSFSHQSSQRSSIVRKDHRTNLLTPHYLNQANPWDWMNLTVASTFARVESSNCSWGSPRTAWKTGMSFGVRPIMVWFWCWSTRY